MSENKPIELKSDDPFVKQVLGNPNLEEENPEGGEGAGDNGSQQSQKDNSSQEQNQQSQGGGAEIDINKVIEEKTGGKFKSIEDLNAIIQEKEAKPKVTLPEFQDDYDKLYWAAAQSGDVSKIKEITKLQSTNIDAMSERDLLKSKLKNELHGLSDEDIENELDDIYGYSLQPLTDEDKELLSKEDVAQHEKQMARAERLRKKDVSTIKEELKKQLEQSKTAMLEQFKDVLNPQVEEVKPAAVAENTKQDAYVEPTEEELTFARNQFEAEVKNILPDVSKITLKDKIEISEGVEEDLEIKYELSEADQKKLIDFLADYELSRAEEKKFITQVDGKEVLDLKGLIQEKAPQVFADKLQKIRDKEVAAKAREMIVKKEIKRVDLTPNSITDRASNINESEANFMKQWANQVNQGG